MLLDRCVGVVVDLFEAGKSGFLNRCEIVMIPDFVKLPGYFESQGGDGAFGVGQSLLNRDEIRPLVNEPWIALVESDGLAMLEIMNAVGPFEAVSFRHTALF